MSHSQLLRLLNINILLLLLKRTLQHTLLSSLTTKLILTQTTPIQFLCICQQSTVSFPFCQFLNQLDRFVVREIL